MPDDSFDLENRLLDQASSGSKAGHLAEARSGLVVPRSYRGLPNFNAACRQAAQQGRPVSLRLSGGGLVPQDRGVINLHLAYAVHTGNPLQQAEQHYLLLCDLLASALADIGIRAAPAAVHGSFCDGRFNLAVNGRKIAGTAQYWRRNPPHAAAPYTLLSHAVLLADADTEALNRAANDFEHAAGSTVRYRSDAITSAAACTGHRTTDALLSALRTRLDAWMAADE